MIKEEIGWKKENNKERMEGKDMSGGPIPNQLESDNAFNIRDLKTLSLQIML